MGDPLWLRPSEDFNFQICLQWDSGNLSVTVQTFFPGHRNRKGFNLWVSGLLSHNSLYSPVCLSNLLGYYLPYVFDSLMHPRRVVNFLSFLSFKFFTSCQDVVTTSKFLICRTGTQKFWFNIFYTKLTCENSVLSRDGGITKYPNEKNNSISLHI